MMTVKKQRFCDFYLISLNATEAAKKAGYTSSRKNGIIQKAYRLMQDPEIKEYISFNLKEKKESIIVKQDEVLIFLSDCVLGKLKEKKYFILRSGSKQNYDDELIEKEVDLQVRDRIKAAEIMCKIYKLMDKGEVKEPQKVVISCDIPKKNEEFTND